MRGVRYDIDIKKMRPGDMTGHLLSAGITPIRREIPRRIEHHQVLI